MFNKKIKSINSLNKNKATTWIVVGFAVFVHVLQIYFLWIRKYSKVWYTVWAIGTLFFSVNGCISVNWWLRILLKLEGLLQHLIRHLLSILTQIGDIKLQSMTNKIISTFPLSIVSVVYHLCPPQFGLFFFFQLLHSAHACLLYTDFISGICLLTQKLLQQIHKEELLKSILHKYIGHHHQLPGRHDMFLFSQATCLTILYLWI